MSTNSPTDRVYRRQMGLSPGVSSFNLLTASKKLQSVLILVKICPGNVLEIMPADLLVTLFELVVCIFGCLSQQYLCSVSFL